jgi:hypothetical protein
MHGRSRCIGNKLKEPPKKPKVSLGDFTGKEPAGGFIGNDDIYEIGNGNGNYSELRVKKLNFISFIYTPNIFQICIL